MQTYCPSFFFIYRCRWRSEEGVCSRAHTCARLHPRTYEHVRPGHTHPNISAFTGKNVMVNLKKSQS